MKEIHRVNYKKSMHDIGNAITEKLHMRKICAKILPKVLPSDQKQHC